MGPRYTTAAAVNAKACKVCGARIWPSKGEGPARYARRVVCSRRCALKLPRTIHSVTARGLLNAELRTPPPGWDRWSVQRTRDWMDAARHADRALQRGAGAKLCAKWLARLQEIRAA